MVKRVRNNILNGVIGVVILLVGVVAGILLLGRDSLDFRNKAMEILEQTYVVCHRVGVTDNRWEEIVVTTEELSTRLNQGDIFGNCPSDIGLENEN